MRYAVISNAAVSSVHISFGEAARALSALSGIDPAARLVAVRGSHYTDITEKAFLTLRQAA